MPRPIVLGVVGDSAAGKTTITRGLVRLIGEERVTHIAGDDYHRYDRWQRAGRGVRLRPRARGAQAKARGFRPAGRDVEGGRRERKGRGGRGVVGPPVRAGAVQFGGADVEGGTRLAGSGQLPSYGGQLGTGTSGGG